MMAEAWVCAEADLPTGHQVMLSYCKHLWLHMRCLCRKLVL